MGDFDKAVFDKTDEPLIVTSKLASEQELLQSIVPHYALTSRSERKSQGVTTDLHVLDEDVCKDCEDVCRDCEKVCEEVICSPFGAGPPNGGHILCIAGHLIDTHDLNVAVQMFSGLKQGIYKTFKEEQSRDRT